MAAPAIPDVGVGERIVTVLHKAKGPVEWEDDMTAGPTSFRTAFGWGTHVQSNMLINR